MTYAEIEEIVLKEANTFSISNVHGKQYDNIIDNTSVVTLSKAIATKIYLASNRGVMKRRKK